MQKTTSAIVLRKIPFGDFDFIVTLFSREYGRISGVAKFARKSKKRFAGALEIGTLVNVAYSEGANSNLLRLIEAIVVRPANGVMKSLKRLHALSAALEMALGFLQERQAAPEKFDLLSEFLFTLSERDPETWDLLAFKWAWVSHSGFKPVMMGCAVCGKGRDGDGDWSFDLENGGLVCDGCAKKSLTSIYLSKYALRGFSELQSGSLFCDDETADDAEKILNRYITHILGKPLKSEMMIGIK